ncbi:MAG: membrane protein insertion efficiency factor YidD [Acidobacteria bacterium]|nr:membrane protein insertion efficiency factor YidD [Acidobacteriota bacterium]
MSVTPAPPSKRHRTAPVWVAAAVLVAVGVADGRRDPDQQVGVRWALAGIRWYQGTLPTWLPTSGATCRFTPTCSYYGRAVIERHGLWKGGGLTLGRLARCGPWTPHGTADPPI